MIWCQGFSEPNSGSDLASVQTAARRDGDGWFVSGQKIWTSYATMAQWCFLLTRTARGDKKQQGLTIFLVPMSDPAIEVRPIASMVGPHHLNEVFFDELWVTEADVLGPVDEGWQVVQEVLAFERVGIARYARCERLLDRAPAVLGDQWESLPEELRARWAESLTHCRRARLLAYRVVGMQQSGRVRPGDVAAYRIAVTRLDQSSAEVLMEIIGQAVLVGDEAQRFKRAVDEHWRYAQASTVASGSIEVQRMLLARRASVGMITELSDEATAYGLTARKVLESAGGDRLAQWAEAEPERRDQLVAPVLAELGAWDLDPRSGADEARGRCGAVPERGVLGGGVPGGGATRPSRDVEADGLLVVNPDVPAAPVAGLSLRWVAVDLLGRRSVAVPRAGTPRPRRDAFVSALELEPLDDKGADDVSLGLVLSCWTLLGMLDRALELTAITCSSGGSSARRWRRSRACSSSSPTARSSGSDWRSWRNTPCGASSPATRRRYATPWRCAPPPSRRPRSSSASHTSSTEPSGSATRRRFRGCRGPACRCVGSPSESPRPGRSSPGAWVGRDCRACSMPPLPTSRRAEQASAGRHGSARDALAVSP